MKTTDLRKYHFYAERLECIEEQLKRNRERNYVCDAVLGDSGEPAHECITKPIEGYIHSIGNVSLNVEKARCKAAMNEIERYILGIEEKRIRTALKLYCMADKKMTWQEVAAEMGERDCRPLVKAVERCLVKIEQNESKKFV